MDVETDFEHSVVFALIGQSVSTFEASKHARLNSNSLAFPAFNFFEFALIALLARCGVFCANSLVRYYVDPLKVLVCILDPADGVIAYAFVCVDRVPSVQSASVLCFLRPFAMIDMQDVLA